MRLLRALLYWFFPRPFFRSLSEARELGKVSLQEIDLGKGQLGWYASIRPHDRPAGPHMHRYQWTGQDADLATALEGALEEARAFPKMVPMTGVPYAPKLGGKEFDE